MKRTAELLVLTFFANALPAQAADASQDADDRMGRTILIVFVGIFGIFIVGSLAVGIWCVVMAWKGRKDRKHPAEEPSSMSDSILAGWIKSSPPPGKSKDTSDVPNDGNTAFGDEL